MEGMKLIMKKESLYEIYLTCSHVTPDTWLSFLNSISKLNGLFRKWNIYITIDKNEVRYFLKTQRSIPPIISSLSEFLIKKTDLKIEDILNFSSRKGKYFILTNKENNILDIFDKAETKYNQSLTLIDFSLFSFKKDHFFTKTNLFFKKSNKKKLINRKALFVIPHIFLSLDFSIYNRFFYKKNANEYLDIQKALPFLRSDNSNALLKVDTFPYLSDDYYLCQHDYDFDKHSIIIGSSGTGKSKLVSSMISNISKNYGDMSHYKFVVIDPHASIKDDIGGLDNTTVIDFKDGSDSCDLFMNVPQKDMVASTELMLSLFKTLMEDQYNSKLERVLRHSVYLLMQFQGLNFKNLRNLILDVEYRSSLINKLQNVLPDSIINFFLTDFNALKSKSYEEAISPIISFIDEMDLLPAFRESDYKPQIKDVINENFLTIFSLDQSVLGKKVTKTISGLVMQQLLELIQSYTFDKHIVLVIDEVALVENPILSRFLSEARKYNLSLILIQQYFSQISEDVRKAIFANVSNFYVFRVSKSDAILLEKNLQMNVAVYNSYKVKLKILTELKNRECIARISNNGVLLPAFKAKTLDFTPCPNIIVNQILKKSTILEDFKPIKQSIKPSLKSEKAFSFGIDNSLISLTDIMASQSSSRKEVKIYG